MKFLKVVRFVSGLPEYLRLLSYFIYLLYKFLSNMQVFFNPYNGFIPKSRLTEIPKETEGGLIHECVSDTELIERYGQRDPMTLDPVFLAERNIEPLKFSGAVVSPLDAHDTIINNAEDAFNNLPKSQPTTSPETTQSPSNEE